MIRRLLPLCLLLSFVSTTKSNIINGSFENGLSDWTVGITGGSAYLYTSSGEPLYYTLDQIPNIFEFSVTPEVKASNISSPWEYQATDGNNLLKINGNGAVPYYWKIDDDFEWEINFAPCTISVSQSVYIKAGETISGDIAFTASEPPYWNYDCAFVEITGPEYKAVPAIITISDVFYNPEELFKSGWKKWNWVAPYDGLFQISLCNAMDVQDASDAYFDNIWISSIPEPCTHYLCITSLLFLFFISKVGKIGRKLHSFFQNT